MKNARLAFLSVIVIAAATSAAFVACGGSSSQPGPDAGSDDASVDAATSGSSSGGGSSGGGSSGGGSSSGATDGGGASSGVGPSAIDASFDGCAAIPSSDLPASSSPAEGTVVGAGLSGLLCPGGASARIESAGARSDTEPYIFYLDYTVGLGSAVTDFQFQTPAAASHGELGVLLGIPSAAPGEYDSPSGAQCGTMAFTYYLPVPPSVDCEAGTPPSCSPGCGAVCSGQGCSPCTPTAPSVGYTAKGSGDCIGSTLTPVGSWHLSLTSVTAAADAGSGTGLRFYLPHGTLTAQLVGDRDAGNATVTAAF
jgi:hypothetical protein